MHFLLDLFYHRIIIFGFMSRYKYGFVEAVHQKLLAIILPYFFLKLLWSSSKIKTSPWNPYFLSHPGGNIFKKVLFVLVKLSFQKFITNSYWRNDKIEIEHVEHVINVYLSTYVSKHRYIRIKCKYAWWR